MRGRLVPCGLRAYRPTVSNGRCSPPSRPCFPPSSTSRPSLCTRDSSWWGKWAHHAQTWQRHVGGACSPGARAGGCLRGSHTLSLRTNRLLCGATKGAPRGSTCPLTPPTTLLLWFSWNFCLRGAAHLGRELCRSRDFLQPSAAAWGVGGGWVAPRPGSPFLKPAPSWLDTVNPDGGVKLAAETSRTGGAGTGPHIPGQTP